MIYKTLYRKLDQHEALEKRGWTGELMCSRRTSNSC